MTWAPPDREPFIAPYYDELAYNHQNYLKLLEYIDSLGGTPPAAIEPEVSVIWTVDVDIVSYDTAANFTGTVNSYSMTFVPSGLSFNTATGELTGTPDSLSGGRPGVVAHGDQFDAAYVLDYSVVPA